MAWCPEVVASRWEVVDRAALRIAENFYCALEEGKGNHGNENVQAPGTLGCARALHAAMVKARKEGMNPILRGIIAREV